MPALTDQLSGLLADYAAGAQLLRSAVGGLTMEQLQARPIPGKWSVHEVVCHLADAELLYADRLKRVIAEERPTLLSMDPDIHVASLAIPERNVAEELSLIELIRSQVSRLLQSLEPEDFQRVGLHSEDGPLTLEQLLGRVTRHVPHHVRFIEEKRRALGAT